MSSNLFLSFLKMSFLCKLSVIIWKHTFFSTASILSVYSGQLNLLDPISLTILCELYKLLNFLIFPFLSFLSSIIDFSILSDISIFCPSYFLCFPFSFFLSPVISFNILLLNTFRLSTSFSFSTHFLSFFSPVISLVIKYLQLIFYLFYFSFLSFLNPVTGIGILLSNTFTLCSSFTFSTSHFCLSWIQLSCYQIPLPCVPLLTNQIVASYQSRNYSIVLPRLGGPHLRPHRPNPFNSVLFLRVFIES